MRQLSATWLSAVVLPQNKDVCEKTFIAILAFIRYAETGKRQCPIPSAKAARQVLCIEATVQRVAGLTDCVGTEKFGNPLQIGE